MPRENKLKASLKTIPVLPPSSNLEEKGLNTFLERVGEKPFDEEHKRLKTQSVLLFQEDAAPLKTLKRYIEDNLPEGVDVSTSKIFRALLHQASADENFLEAYRNLK